ncbi:2-oxoglutarate dehydrogenase E1 component [Sulfobacillus thermosulfidooxidans]|uniref:2-oxoglutarate dehydrogenase E1 component n=1 Tax=Sulfobacillus thermosulfidooxidans TaxID=28034 RepID=UPI00041BCD23|nr:2-oxoglutarate dehydrogenase E1 component [Sulfobacillus thermosulfidooxidans]
MAAARELHTLWQEFYGPNAGYIMELYEQYLRDPASIDEASRRLFEQWGPPPNDLATEDGASPVTISDASLEIIRRGTELARNIREYGHLQAHLNPLANRVPSSPLLRLETYGLTPEQLQQVPAKSLWPNCPPNLKTGWDAIEELFKLYTGTVAYEFSHVHNVEERQWLIDYVESHRIQLPLSPVDKRTILRRLIAVDQFEKFLHHTFPGQKRFSIEGTDAMVPMLDRLIHLTATTTPIRNVVIGMAHRGRLNVLAHILGKPYADIFAEFHSAPNKDLVPSAGSAGINFGWTGDVKYHLGARKIMQESNMVEMRLALANNPSHLEFVDPVVEGMARALQDSRQRPGAPVQDVDRALAVLIHGDASFPGEGVVSETLNLSRLAAYNTGGTVHIIANNFLGFTTEPDQGRSTLYASDLAKGFEIPIVHVNGDDIEACLGVIEMAHAYRQAFHKDFLIDLVGYRRWGHNEGDDPSVTQPVLYHAVASHPVPWQVYAKRLEDERMITEEAVNEIIQAIQDDLRSIYQKLTRGEITLTPRGNLPEEPANPSPAPISRELLNDINQELLRRPKGFQLYPKLEKILAKRQNALTTPRGVDWALAETLAMGTILADGIPIRMTGQDSERGTFSQRHLVLHDVQTGDKFSPLEHLSHARASFLVANSPLSETAVLGFEYGYSTQAPDTLVFWEAQYGDFANVGQVLFDQFIAPGRAKWLQSSGLVMLLPHGYEGQGPEHSSARLERFLQLSADENWRVTIPTSAAQYFHLLRSQAAWLKERPRPLVVLTPKSLLRNPLAASDVTELVQGQFQPLYPLPVSDPSQVTRLVLTAGKIGIEIAQALKEQDPDAKWIALARVEQLYPFPSKELDALVASLPHLEEVYWVQEEPQNMGAWTYIATTLQYNVKGLPLKYVGRQPHSAPAEGFAQHHAIEQDRIIHEAISR